MHPSRDIGRLIEIMAALRTPGSGCPWDLDQTFETIAPYTIEEAYEIADAIARGDLSDLKDELGDLLLQVVFHARMAEEIPAFDFGDVCLAITEKLIRRHPHVFGDGDAADPRAVKQSWEAIKAEERTAKAARRNGETGKTSSILDDVPVALPALTRAVKLQKRAGRVGFDWSDARLVLNKIREETEELDSGLEDNDTTAVSEELGDLLFAVANLARHLDVDPEAALRNANEKFRRRFRHIEARVCDTGSKLGEVDLDQMERWWQEAKAGERG